MITTISSSARLFSAKKCGKLKGIAILCVRLKSGSGNNNISESKISCLPKIQATRKLKVITNNWIRELKKNDVPEAELSVRYIVEKVLAQSSIERKGRLPMVKDVASDQEEQISRMCHQRLERQPIQYIIGDWDFRYLTLMMKHSVFIPRPETEDLVDIIANYHLPSRTHDFKFLEVGCGSGAICLSILKEYKQTTCVAIDINPEAVSLTTLNATRYGLEDRLKVFNGNIENFRWNHKFDAIISNPPYIPRQDMESLDPEVKRYEDETALCGGKDGMDVIKLISTAALHLLQPYGSIWLEIDLSHPPLVTKWLQDNHSLGLKLNKFYNDFTNRRLISGYQPCNPSWDDNLDMHCEKTKETDSMMI